MTQPSKQVVSGPGVPPVIGPYSAGVRAGELLFVSGQAGMDPESSALGDGFRAQATQALRNLQAVLEAGGSRLDLVVNTTVLLADFGVFAELNEVFEEFFPSDPPARMTMATPLPGDVLISVGCVALVAAPGSG